MMEAPTKARSLVYVDLAPGECLGFGDTGLQVEVVAKSGRHARLRIVMPRNVVLTRESSVFEKVHKADASMA